MSIEKAEPKGSEPSSSELCECGHPHANHHWHGARGDACTGNRNLCSCRMFRAKPKECQHPDNEACDRCMMPRSYYIPCRCGHVQGEHRTFTEGGCRNCACDSFKLPSVEPEEPPKPILRCTCGPDEACGDCPEPRCKGCGYIHRPNAHTCGHATDESECCACRARQEPEEPPLTPEEEEQAPEDCDCDASFPDPCPGREEIPPPPQPDRRPPYAVAYSVQGHLYEVAVSGDATVHAVDGALVIRHHLGPVAGITQVLPVINKES